MARDEERVIHTKCNRERFEDEKEKKTSHFDSTCRKREVIIDYLLE